jgi:hypothetical protein
MSSEGTPDGYLVHYRLPACNYIYRPRENSLGIIPSFRVKKTDTTCSVWVCDFVPYFKERTFPVYCVGSISRLKIQGICPHVSDRPSDQSTQLGHFSHLDSHYHSRSQKTTTPSSVDWVGKFVFVVLMPYREFFSLVMTSILIVLWPKASYMWSF